MPKKKKKGAGSPNPEGSWCPHGPLPEAPESPSAGGASVRPASSFSGWTHIRGKRSHVFFQVYSGPTLEYNCSNSPFWRGRNQFCSAPHPRPQETLTTPSRACAFLPNLSPGPETILRALFPFYPEFSELIRSDTLIGISCSSQPQLENFPLIKINEGSLPRPRC